MPFRSREERRISNRGSKTANEPQEAYVSSGALAKAERRLSDDITMTLPLVLTGSYRASGFQGYVSMGLGTERGAGA